MATTAAVALDLHYSQTIVSISADTMESGDEALVDMLLQIGCAEHKFFSLLFGFSQNRIQLVALLVQINGLILDIGDCFCFLSLAILKVCGEVVLMKIYRTKQIESNEGQTIVSEGIDANYMDMINYSVFGLIKIDFGE